MTQEKHIKTLKNLQALQQKKDEKYEQIIKKIKAKREPIRISFDWTFSKFFWRFILICAIVGISIFGNAWQFVIYRENTQTIRELENYSTIFRFARANNGIRAIDIDRIWQDLEKPDTTDLLRVVYDIIWEFESGESVVRQTRN